MPEPYQHDLEINRLRRALLKRWWGLTGVLWLTVGSLSLWHLRDELTLLKQHFTWTAVRYGLADNRLAALGLASCLGLTVALLVGESRYILFGIAAEEYHRLQKLHQQIEKKGRSHPLWRQVHPND
jgi:hypothetical protein